jgi:hypothetical protein
VANAGWQMILGRPSAAGLLRPLEIAPLLLLGVCSWAVRCEHHGHLQLSCSILDGGQDYNGMLIFVWIAAHTAQHHPPLQSCGQLVMTGHHCMLAKFVAAESFNQYYQYLGYRQCLLATAWAVVRCAMSAGCRSTLRSRWDADRLDSLLNLLDGHAGTCMVGTYDYLLGGQVWTLLGCLAGACCR